MKVVILAGGMGTRLSEETVMKPKPMVEIGGYPILWHIMKIYSFYGFNDFIICLGYKGFTIKEYFMNYFANSSNLKIDTSKNKIEVLNNRSEDWTVTLVDTGINTMTGGRIKRVKDYIEEQTFMLTYGDGVADVNISKLVEFHSLHGKAVTVTAVQPEGRYGSLRIGNDGTVHNFIEKPPGDGGWVNGGFYVLKDEVFDYIGGDETVWEQAPMYRLSEENKVKAYRHNGFWKAMDTLSDKRRLEEIWDSGRAPWKVWKK